MPGCPVLVPGALAGPRLLILCRSNGVALQVQQRGSAVSHTGKQAHGGGGLAVAPEDPFAVTPGARRSTSEKGGDRAGTGTRAVTFTPGSRASVHAPAGDREGQSIGEGLDRREFAVHENSLFRFGSCSSLSTLE